MSHSPWTSNFPWTEVRTCAVRHRGPSVVPAILLSFPAVERATLCRLLLPRRRCASGEGGGSPGMLLHWAACCKGRCCRNIWQTRDPASGTSYVPLAEMTHALPSDHPGSEAIWILLEKENSGFIQSHLGAFF